MIILPHLALAWLLVLGPYLFLFVQCWMMYRMCLHKTQVDEHLRELAGLIKLNSVALTKAELELFKLKTALDPPQILNEGQTELDV